MVVRDDEHTVADAGAAGGGREVLLAGQGMAPLPFDRQVGQLDAEERRAGYVCLEVELAPRLPAVELVGAVDEAVLDQ
jgi:hypothetical protein